MGREVRAADVHWAGNDNDPWDVNTTQNFSTTGGGAADTKFQTNDNVKFGDTKKGTVAVDSSGVTVGNMNVVTGSADGDEYIFTGGSITSTTGALTVTANKDITFKNEISLTGNSVINAGKVVLESGFQFGTLKIETGGMLLINPGADLSANTTIFTGGGTIQKTGTKSIEFTNHSDGFEGALKVDDGTLILRASGSFAGTSSVTLGGTAVIDMTNVTTGASLGGLTGGGEVKADGKTLTLLGTSTYNGIISGTGGNVVVGATGAGNLTLTKTQTYTGSTTITNGVLALSGSDASIAASSGVSIAASSGLDISGTGDQTIKSLNGSGEVILGNNTLTIQNDSTVAPGSYAGNIKGDGGNGGLTLNTNAKTDVFTLTGANDYIGATTVTKGVLALGNANAIAASSGVDIGADGTLDITATDATVQSLSGGGNVKLGGKKLTIEEAISTGGNVTYSGVIDGTDASGLELKLNQNNSSVTLSGNNTYTGKTTITKGTLKAGTAAAVASTSGIEVGANGVFDITATNATVKSLSGAGKVDLGGNKLTIEETTSTGGDVTYAGVIDGTDASGLELKLNQSDSSVTLSGNNTYLGKTTVTKGTLKAGTAAAVASTSGIELGANGVFDITATDATVKSLSGTGEVNLGAKKLTIAETTSTNTSNVNYDGVIGGAGGGIELNLNDADSRYTLSNANTYTGETLITKGTLALKNGAAIDDSAKLTLKATEGKLLLENSAPNTKIDANVKTLFAETGSAIDLGDNTLTLKGDSSTLSNDLGELSGTITGAGNLVIDAQDTADQFVVKSATGHTGETGVTKGTLKLDNAGSLANSSKVTVGTAGKLDASSVATSTTLKQLSGAGEVDIGGKELVLGTTDAFTGAINGAGGNVTVSKIGSTAANVTFEKEQGYTGVTKIGEGALTLKHGDAIKNSSTVVFDDANAVLNLANDNTNTAIEASVKTIGESAGIAGKINLGDNTLAIQDSSSFSGVIAGADGNLKFMGGAGKELALSGINTYTGDTYIKDGGTLTLTGDGSIESSEKVTLNGAAKLTVDRAESKIKAIDGDAASSIDIASGNTLTLKGATGGSMGVFSGNLGTAGQRGNLKLDGANNSDKFTLGKSALYTGTTEVAKGTLKLADNVNLNTSSEIMLSGNGALDLSAQTVTDHNLTTKLTSSAGSSIILGTKTLTLSNTATSFVGSINSANPSNLGNLTLTGGTTVGTGAKVELTGGSTNSMGDVTLANGGVLKVGAGASLTSTKIDVNSAGTLDAAGVINGDVTIASGGLFKNNFTNTLTINGGFTAQSSSNVDLTLAGVGANGIRVDGALGIHGNVTIAAGGAGIYNLFVAGGTLDYTGALLDAGTYGATWQTSADGKTLQVRVSESGQFLLTWAGAAGSGAKWDATSQNWLDSATPETWKDSAGTVAVFNNAAAQKDVTVVDTRRFDTIQFGADGYVLNDGTLQFNSYNGKTATIVAGNGVTATINSKLTDGSGTNTELAVNGGGTLILSNTNSDYSGGTVIGEGTTLQLNNGKNAAGTGSIGLDSAKGGANLALNFSDSNFDRKITDSGSGKGDTNTVKIMDGNNIAFTTDQHYTAATVIGKGSSLTAGAGGDLSANSLHYLDENASLILASGDETIGGLAGETGSTLALGDNKLTVNQGENALFEGNLTGGTNAAFIKNGTGNLVIDNLDTSVYNGTFTTSDAGILALYAKNNTDMNLRLAASANANGTIMAATGSNNQNITVSGGGYTGKLEIERGNVVLNADGATSLAGGSLKLDFGVSMDVNTNASVGKLDLNGNAITFGDNGSGGLATLTATGGFTVASGSTNLLYVDSSKLGGATGSDFFSLANGGSNTLLIAGANNASASNFAVGDLNGKSLEGTMTDSIVQGGDTVGTAVFEGGVTVDNKGVSYGRKLTEIFSSSSQGVVIDSSDGANAGVGARGIQSRAGGQKDMSAKLSGNSFVFQGSDNILVSNPNNNYIGSTVVNMATNNTTVTAGVDNAFGSTSLLDIQRGGVNVNNKTMNVGALTGNANTKLNLGTGNGTLNIRGGNRTDESVYAGDVTGAGNIVKSGNGSQLFTGRNNLIGNITLNGGSLAWSGALNGNRTSTGNVTANGGDFIQAGSTVAGNVTVGGSGSSISGYGTIGGNLTVNNGGTYKISVDSGRVDHTSVGGKTTFGQGSSIIFNNEALNYMYMNPSSNLNIITSGGGFDLSKSPWKDGVIKINMGILGTARLEASGSSLTYTELEAPTGSTGSIITGVWSQKGVNVGGVLGHSGLGNSIMETFTRFNTDDAWMVDIDPNVNARFASAKFMGLGPDILGGLSYSRAEVLSVFNHESGLSATQPVDAAMDTTRTMIGQGIMNRVNSLRAARTILSNTAQMPVAGNGQAYGSLLVGEGGYINADGSVTPDTAVAAATYAPVYSQGYGYDYRNSSMRVWAGGIGHWSKYDTSSGGIGGYKYNSGGVMVGMDGSVGAFTMGGAFGYTRGTLKDKLALSSSSDIDSYSLSLYTDYNHESGVNTMFFGGAELFDNDISRRVAGYRDDNGTIVADYGKENSDYRGYGWYLGTNVSYDFLPTDNLTITPSIGLTYADVRSKAFTRRTVRDSGTILTDRVSAVKRRSISMPIDVAVTYDAMVKQDEKVSILGNVGYAYEFRNKGAEGDLIWGDVNGASPIRFTGRDPGRSAWNLGIGARYQRRNVDFDVKYDYTTRKDLTTHRVSATVGFEF